MKLRFGFKDPDAVFSACDQIKDKQEREEVMDKISCWFKYGEYADFEYDTETDTLTFLPAISKKAIR